MLGAALSLLPGIATAAGGLFGLFGGNKGKDPSEEANKYLNQIPGAVNPYYQPYINQGREAGEDLTGRYNNMLNNPGDLYNKLGAGYKESPGYQTRLKQALQSVTNAEAAGGMAGSPEHQLLAAQKGVELSGKDFEDYLKHILGIYGTGLQGEQGREERGYNAGTNYGNILANVLGQQGKMAYEGANAENTKSGQNWSNIFTGIGAAGAGYNSYNNNQNILELLGGH